MCVNRHYFVLPLVIIWVIFFVFICTTLVARRLCFLLFLWHTFFGEAKRGVSNENLFIQFQQPHGGQGKEDFCSYTHNQRSIYLIQQGGFQKGAGANRQNS